MWQNSVALPNNTSLKQCLVSIYKSCNKLFSFQNITDLTQQVSRYVKDDIHIPQDIRNSVTNIKFRILNKKYNTSTYVENDNDIQNNDHLSAVMFSQSTRNVYSVESKQMPAGSSSDRTVPFWAVTQSYNAQSSHTITQARNNFSNQHNCNTAQKSFYGEKEARPESNVRIVPSTSREPLKEHINGFLNSCTLPQESSYNKPKEIESNFDVRPSTLSAYISKRKIRSSSSDSSSVEYVGLFPKGISNGSSGACHASRQKGKNTRQHESRYRLSSADSSSSRSSEHCNIHRPKKFVARDKKLSHNRSSSNDSDYSEITSVYKNRPRQTLRIKQSEHISRKSKSSESDQNAVNNNDRSVKLAIHQKNNRFLEESQRSSYDSSDCEKDFSPRKNNTKMQRISVNRIYNDKPKEKRKSRNSQSSGVGDRRSRSRSRSLSRPRNIRKLRNQEHISKRNNYSHRRSSRNRSSSVESRSSKNQHESRNREKLRSDKQRKSGKYRYSVSSSSDSSADSERSRKHSHSRNGENIVTDKGYRLTKNKHSSNDHCTLKSRRSESIDSQTSRNHSVTRTGRNEKHISSNDSDSSNDSENSDKLSVKACKRNSRKEKSYQLGQHNSSIAGKHNTVKVPMENGEKIRSERDYRSGNRRSLGVGYTKRAKSPSETKASLIKKIWSREKHSTTLMNSLRQSSSRSDNDRKAQSVPATFQSAPVNVQPNSTFTNALKMSSNMNLKTETNDSACADPEYTVASNDMAKPRADNVPVHNCFETCYGKRAKCYDQFNKYFGTAGAPKSAVSKLYEICAQDKLKPPVFELTKENYGHKPEFQYKPFYQTTLQILVVWLLVMDIIELFEESKL